MFIFRVLVFFLGASSAMAGQLDDARLGYSNTSITDVLAGY